MDRRACDGSGIPARRPNLRKLPHPAGPGQNDCLHAGKYFGGHRHWYS